MKKLYPVKIGIVLLLATLLVYFSNPDSGGIQQCKVLPEMPRLMDFVTRMENLWRWAPFESTKFHFHKIQGHFNRKPYEIRKKDCPSDVTKNSSFSLTTIDTIDGTMDTIIVPIVKTIVSVVTTTIYALQGIYAPEGKSCEILSKIVLHQFSRLSRFISGCDVNPDDASLYVHRDGLCQGGSGIPCRDFSLYGQECPHHFVFHNKSNIFEEQGITCKQ
ncbi:MAG: hypothetical protein FWG50_02720 [Kiritimatiellaeota bacterium]|nr:hypothetical protein [Kiritimatiellota bacterium]